MGKRDIMTTYYTVLNKVKTINKCIECRKKSKVLVSQISDNKIHISPLCRKCFKIEMPDYTLEYACITCDDNLKCDLQKILFTNKEIKQFKEDNEL